MTNLNTTAYALDALIPGSPADHTYVVCASDSFGCFGTDHGGHALNNTQGYNDLNKVRILNADYSIKVNIPRIGNLSIGSQGGILYAVNGVCHTMANRLMVQSRNTVASARGAVQSSALFGLYGTKIPGSATEVLLGLIGRSLPELVRMALDKLAGNVLHDLVEMEAQAVWHTLCAKAGVPYVERDRLAVTDESKAPQIGLPTDLLYAGKVNSPDTWADYHRLEMEYVWQDFLGEGADPGKIRELLAVQDDLHKGQNLLQADRDGDAPLSDAINRAATRLTAEYRKVLNAEEHTRLAGADGTAPVIIADPAYEKAFYSTPGRIVVELEEPSTLPK